MQPAQTADSVRPPEPERVGPQRQVIVRLAESAPKLTETPVKKQTEVPRLLPLVKADRGQTLLEKEPRQVRLSPPATQGGHIQLDAATLHRIQLNAPIERIVVEDRYVCEAFSQADRELKLVAKRDGETSVTIYYRTAKAPAVYTVRVGSQPKQQDRIPINATKTTIAPKIIRIIIEVLS